MSGVLSTLPFLSRDATDLSVSGGHTFTTPDTTSLSGPQSPRLVLWRKDRHVPRCAQSSGRTEQYDN